MAESLAVSITPFTKTGQLDLEGAVAHLERLLGAGLPVVVGGSGTEEGFVLSDAERREFVTLAAQLAARHGTHARLNAREPRSAADLIAEVELASSAGCAAVHIPIVDVGHGYAAGRDEVESYLRAALEAADGFPAYVSTSVFVGKYFPIDVLTSVADEYPIAGYVCLPPNLPYLADLVDLAAGRSKVYLAGVSQVLNGLALGADGFLSPEANIAPDVCREAAVAATSGDWGKAVAAANALIRLNAAMRGWGGAVSIKACLRGLGLLETYSRPPRTDAPDEAAAAIGKRAEELLAGWRAARGPSGLSQAGTA